MKCFGFLLLAVAAVSGSVISDKPRISNPPTGGKTLYVPDNKDKTFYFPEHDASKTIYMPGQQGGGNSYYIPELGEGKYTIFTLPNGPEADEKTFYIPAPNDGKTIYLSRNGSDGKPILYQLPDGALNDGHLYCVPGSAAGKVIYVAGQPAIHANFGAQATNTNANANFGSQGQTTVIM